MEGNGRDRSEEAVVNSALWAAAGDALGWITELSHGPAGVARRTGKRRVDKPVAWQRRVGGRNGPTVDLPAGTYSDDTQLRLAVGRSIRGDGSFDVETFAKIEVTVWPTYALGAGSGTMAAARWLARPTVNWFSNFFDDGRKRYVSAGGNGASMRIQPHVWAGGKDRDRLILDVLRDALATHGHPHGFCGAVFHALCLADALVDGKVPTVAQCKGYAKAFLDLERLVSGDAQLSAFWQGCWEDAHGSTLHDAVGAMHDEANRDIERVQGEMGRGNGDRTDVYRSILSELGCLEEIYRGSGFKTALAALALAQLFRPGEMEECLTTAANELESDTDTIATMAGALLGSVSDRPPEWPVQDREYIAREARRLFAISRGNAEDSFRYPEPSVWNPPNAKIAGVGTFEDGLALAGLGKLSALGGEIESARGIWQWFALPFGQSVLARRGRHGNASVAASQLPGNAVATGLMEARRPRTAGLDEHRRQPPLQPGSDVPMAPRSMSRRASTEADQRPEQASEQELPATVDSWTSEVISSDFDDRVLGRMMNLCIDRSRSVEAAIGFSSIIAKAKLARLARKRNR